MPDPDGNPVRATVIARGGPGDAVEMNVDGHAVKRDVAIVRHEEGKSEDFVAHVPYDDLRATADELAEVPDEIEAPAEIGIECRWRMDRAQWLSE